MRGLDHGVKGVFLTLAAVIVVGSFRCEAANRVIGSDAGLPGIGRRSNRYDETSTRGHVRSVEKQGVRLASRRENAGDTLSFEDEELQSGGLDSADSEQVMQQSAPPEITDSNDTRRGSGEGPRFGLMVENPTRELAGKSGDRSTVGIVVTAVVPGSAAEDAGIRPGDSIVEANRIPVRSVREYLRALKDVKAGGSIAMMVRRGNNTFLTGLHLRPDELTGK